MILRRPAGLFYFRVFFPLHPPFNVILIDASVSVVACFKTNANVVAFILLILRREVETFTRIVQAIGFDHQFALLTLVRRTNWQVHDKRNVLNVVRPVSYLRLIAP